MSDEKEKQRLIQHICNDIQKHGPDSEIVTEIKARLQLTSLDVIRRIAATKAVDEAFAAARMAIA